MRFTQPVKGLSRFVFVLFSLVSPCLLAAQNEPSVQYVTAFQGATADAQIAKCLAAISPGGICDARGLGATTQILAGQITVGGGQSLIFNPATKFQAASDSLSPIVVGVNSKINGLWFDCGNQPSYSGTVFTLNQAYWTGANENHTQISDVLITCAHVKTGNGAILSSNGTTAQFVGFVTIRDFRQVGLLNGILLTAYNNGWVNGNHFVNIEVSNIGAGGAMLHFTNNGGQLNRNVCSPCSFESSTGEGSAMIFDGTADRHDTAQGNQWFGPVWDSNVAFVFANAKAANNLAIGGFDGTVQDPHNQNNWIDLQNDRFVGQHLSATFGFPVNFNSWVSTNGKVSYSPTAPTIVSGFGRDGSVLQQNGTAAFEISAGRSGDASSGTVGLARAANGWSCSVANLTANAGSRGDETVITDFSTTSVTVQNQNRSTGQARAWTPGDKLLFNCAAF
jgi:hypothetical protein